MCEVFKQALLVCFILWVCLCSVIGLGSEIMQTYCLAPGNKGDLWDKGALMKEIPDLLDRLWSKSGLEESGERERKTEKK